MKKTLLTICFFVPLISFGIGRINSIIAINKLPAVGLLLNKGWKFHAGDNPTWAKQGVDDRNWANIDPSQDIYFLPQVRNAQIGWFRLKLNVSPSLFNKTLGMVVYQTGASEIYLNGRLIYRLGHVSKGNKDGSMRFYDEQLALQLDSGQIQEIAVRFSCNKNDLIVNYLTPNYCSRLV